MKTFYQHICLIGTILLITQGCDSSDDPPFINGGDPTQESLLGEIPILQDSFVITTFELAADEDPVDISSVELAI